MRFGPDRSWEDDLRGLESFVFLVRDDHRRLCVELHARTGIVGTAGVAILWILADCADNVH